MRRALIGWSLWGVLCSGEAFAQVEGAAPPAADVSRKAPVPPRTYVNLRAGGSSFNPVHPEICLEGAPVSFLSIEMCGTGSGFLHNDPAPEIAHFRGKYLITSWHTERLWLQPNVVFGFAELQVGEDAPGFQFTGVGPDGISTAGPELGVGLRALYPMGDHVELIGELNLSGAYMPHAPRLVVPMNRFQPTATFTLGVGF